jgi:hypothetical protein
MNGEVTEPGLWQIEHPNSIGEYKANISTAQNIGFLAFPSVFAEIEYPKNLSIVGRTSRRRAKAHRFGLLPGCPLFYSVEEKTSGCPKRIPFFGTNRTSKSHSAESGSTQHTQ